MNPDEQYENCSTTISSQQTTMPTGESLGNNIQSLTGFPPLYAITSQAQKLVPKIPRYIKVLSTICMADGVISVIGAILSVVCLTLGVLPSLGFFIVLNFLLGMGHNAIVMYGTLLCIITIILIFLAKYKSHIPIKEPLLITVGGLIMIWIPAIILRLLFLFA